MPFADLEGPPRVLWKQESEGDSSERLHGRSYDTTDVERTRRYRIVHSAPLAFAVELHETKESSEVWYDGGGIGGTSSDSQDWFWTRIHDTESGALLFRITSAAHGDPLAILGDVVLHAVGRIRSYELRPDPPHPEGNPRTLKSIAIPLGLRVEAIAQGGALLFRDDGTLWLRRIPDPRSAPRPNKLVKGAAGSRLWLLRAHEDLAAAILSTKDGKRLHVIDLDRAESVYSTPFEDLVDQTQILLDSQGWVVAVPDRVTCGDRDGTVRWSRDLKRAEPVSLGRSAVLIKSDGAWLVADRAGDRMQKIEGLEGATTGAIGRDRVYFGVGKEVRACDLSGSPLRRFPLPGAITQIAVLPRKLVVLCGPSAYGLGPE